MKIKNDNSIEHQKKMFERGIRRGRLFIEQLESFGLKCKNLKILEIGCAYGGILKAFEEHGNEVLGCDTSPAVKYGVSQGLKLHQGDLGTCNHLGKFDMIILSHVLEHISNPDSFLKSLKELLSPKAKIFIEVPGIKDEAVDWNRITQIGHLWYFSLDTLKSLMQNNGFTFINGSEKANGLFLYEPKQSA